MKYIYFGFLLCLMSCDHEKINYIENKYESSNSRVSFLEQTNEYLKKMKPKNRVCKMYELNENILDNEKGSVAKICEHVEECQLDYKVSLILPMYRY